MFKSHYDAVLAAVRATAGAMPVHEVGKVPANPATPYTVAALSTGTPDDYRESGQHSSRDFRVALQHFGKSVDEVSFALDKGETALLDKRISVAGRKTTKCRQEIATDIDRDPDAGSLLYAVTTYTFTSDPA